VSSFTVTTTSSFPMISTLLKRLGAVFLGIGFALVLLEILARVFHLGSGGFWEPNSLYGWRNIPDATGWESCYGECAVYVTINSRGLRDREIPYEQSPGQTRILFLGDSLTAAMQVPLEETFVKVIETRLNTDAGSGRWEAINGAVNGFGTDNELLFFRLEASKYRPDVVILAMYPSNDVENNSRELELRYGGQEHKPYFVLNEANQLVLMNFPVEGTDSFSVRVGTFLKKHFQLPRFVAQVLSLRSDVPDWLKPLVSLLGGGRGGQADAGSNAQAERQGSICDEEYTPEIQQAWTLTKAILKQLRAEVEATGARFAVAVIPTSVQLLSSQMQPVTADGDWFCDRPHEELSSFLDQEGVPYLDLLRPFREHVLAGGAPLYYTRDFHMNSEGHRLAGELLYQFVMEKLAP